MEIEEENTGLWVRDATGGITHFSHTEEAVAVCFVLYVYSCRNTHDRDWLFQSASKHCAECFCNDSREFSHVLDWVSSISPQEIPTVIKCWKTDYRQILAIKICTEEIILDPIHYIFKMEEVISNGDFVKDSLEGSGNQNQQIRMDLQEDSKNFVKICIGTLRNLVEGDQCITKTK
jgi:hypothetical protein